ncbi:MAG: FkbM family methyltransferase [Methanomicrobiales archaeon]|nr:FkbM family methyltransferase [Methanomicrobiales archaeon]
MSLEMAETGTSLPDLVGKKEFSKPGQELSTISTRDNIRFMNVPTGYRQIYEVPEYRFSDIRKDDIVVDIGANVGAFCIRAAYYSSFVYAVEPLTSEILQQNIQLNDVSVTVLECALGGGNIQGISWDGVRKDMQTVSLKTIIGMTGGCDFLKCDCEGAEWLIDPKDLGPIRRIEMELHLPPISGPPNPRFLDYISRNYNFQVDYMPTHAPLGLLGYLHATRDSESPW